jgi:hypothetical protein
MESTQLLNKALGETWVFLQPSQLIWMLQQCHDAKVDHVDHRCVASYKKQKSNLDGVFFAQVSGFDLVDDEFSDEVVFGFGTSLVNETGEVVEKDLVSIGCFSGCSGAVGTDAKPVRRV